MSRSPVFSLSDIDPSRIVNAEDRKHFEGLKAGNAPAGKKKRNRGNKKTTVDGLKFDSLLESQYYGHLKLLVAAGEVIRFHRQVEFILDGGVRYFADFLVFYADNSVQYVDTKGHKEPVYKLKKKQVEARYDIQIIEIKKGDF